MCGQDSHNVLLMWKQCLFICDFSQARRARITAVEFNTSPGRGGGKQKRKKSSKLACCTKMFELYFRAKGFRAEGIQRGQECLKIDACIHFPFSQGTTPALCGSLLKAGSSFSHLPNSSPDNTELHLYLLLFNTFNPAF